MDRKTDETRKCLHVLNALKSHMETLKSLDLSDEEKLLLHRAFCHIAPIQTNLEGLFNEPEVKPKKNRRTIEL